MSDEKTIVYLTDVFRLFLSGSYIGHLDQSVRNTAESAELKQLFDLIERSLAVYNHGVHAVKSIAEGELHFEIPEADTALLPLQQLQSKLKQLIWQTQQIAAGDYEQHIDFIGDFSSSFNQLILSLKSKRELEQEVAERQKKIQLIADNINDVIWTYDIASRKYSYVSPSIYRMLGIRAEEIVNESFEEIMTPESVQKTLLNYHFILQNKLTSHHLCDTYQFIRKDGQLIDVEICTSVIFDENSQPVELLGITRDITERKKAEQALKESEERYRLITDNSGDTIWTVDIATQKITFISPSVINLTGYKADEVIENGFKFFLLPESRKKEMRYFSFVVSRIKKQQLIPRWKGLFQIRRKDGQISYIESSTNIIYDEKGDAKEIIGVSRDITKRKKIEQAIKEKEEKYRLITENTLDVIWKIDIKKLKYSYMSPSVKKMAGFSPEEILKVPLAEALHPDSFQRVLQLIHERNTLPPEKELYICERFKIFAKDRRIIDIEASANFIRNRNGEVTEIVGVSRDISERVKIENALIKSEARLTELLALQSVKNKQLSKQLQYIFNNASNAIAFFDIEDDTIRFSSCNQQWANKIGYSSKGLEGFDIANLSDKETAALYRKIILKTLDIKHPIEEYVVWKNLHLHVISIPIINEQTGNITSCGALVYNISEKVEADRKIKETEERFISVFNNSKDAIILLNMQLEIVDVNESFYQLHGSRDYPTQDILNTYFPKEYHKLVGKLLTDMKSGLSIPSFDCEVIKHDGTTVNVEISTSTITYRNEPMLLCTIRDISSKKEMERMLNNVSTQIETRERKRLAADLHDNVGPLLSSMNMYLSVLSRKDDLQPYSETLNDIKRILKDTISSVREISNNLSPHVLNNFGLTAALNQFFETKKKLINIQINNTIGDLRFPELKEIMIYNIIIEAYNNSLKHAEADLITLEIFHKNDSIHFTYSDNGIGFDWEEKMKNSNHHLGLFSIINRVKILDGNFNIETSPGNGFLLKIIFPINSK